MTLMPCDCECCERHAADLADADERNADLIRASVADALKAKAEIDQLKTQCLKLGVSREAWKDLALAYRGSRSNQPGSAAYGSRVRAAKLAIRECGEDPEEGR